MFETGSATDVQSTVTTLTSQKGCLMADVKVQVLLHFDGYQAFH